jgi:hypothetical protein
MRNDTGNKGFDFEYLTVWRLPVELDRVYGTISAPSTWPSWWPGCERVEETEKGDARGVGSKRRYTWKSVLPYRVRVDVTTTAVVPGGMLRGQSSGDLHGIGTWTFAVEGGVTRVEYLWQVNAQRAWMRRHRALLSPVFKWNHDRLMQAGGHGLAQWLGAAWIEIRHLAPAPARVVDEVCEGLGL